MTGPAATRQAYHDRLLTLMASHPRVVCVDTDTGLFTAADSAAAIVSLTVWGADSRITTTDMNIRFLSPARSDVMLFAQAIKQGRTLIPVIANFWRDDGTLVAVAQVTYMRLT